MRKFAVAAGAILILSGCAGQTPRESNALTGAAVGGTTGALIGGVASRTFGGAVAGGVIGAVAGGVIGAAVTPPGPCYVRRHHHWHRIHCY
jgi:osmotically inducible lipoprotein OsmB